MDQESVKALLLRDKGFLKSLYESSSTLSANNTLTSASDVKLNTLIKFIHLVANGEIKIKKNHYDALNKKQMKTIERHLESKTAVKRLLKEERQEKLKVLKRFSPVAHQLLYTLFNQN